MSPERQGFSPAIPEDSNTMPEIVDGSVQGFGEEHVLRGGEPSGTFKLKIFKIRPHGDPAARSRFVEGQEIPPGFYVPLPELKSRGLI